MKTDRDEHLEKCRAAFIGARQAGNPKMPMEKKICRYNHAHVVIAEEFNFHEQHCCQNKDDYNMSPDELEEKLGKFSRFLRPNLLENFEFSWHILIMCRVGS